MTSAVAFLAAIAAIIAWYLSQQRLMAKPWLEQGVIGDHTAAGADPAKVAKVGLGVFLAVVGSLFALLVSAYSIRMDMQDWRALPVPKLLWLNTALLIVSSMALQQARLAAHRGALGDARVAMLAAGATCIAFLAGQLMAWQQLAGLGYAAARNPANAFFYLITGLHGLHLLGGLVALALAGARLRRGGPPARLCLSIDLCAIYWHFLLLIWFVLFGLLLFT